jgi:hypothetical protein
MHARWVDEARDLLLDNRYPHEIAEALDRNLAQVVDQLSEAGVEFRGKLGRESAARRADRRRGSRDELARQLLLAQAETAHVRQQLNAAREEVKRWFLQSEEMAQRVHERQAQIDRLEIKLTRAYADIHSTEPGPVEGCTKVRLRDRDEAWEFARRVAEDTGQRFELFDVYACDICPRQPIGTSRFLHITSKESDQERLEARARSGGQRKRNGTALGDRIDPAVLERLKGVS